MRSPGVFAPRTGWNTAMGEKLTKADIEKIQEEIDHRKIDLRPELAAAVRDAAAQGDRSENFEYYAAKRENRRNESRIAYLERMLKYATVIEDHSKEDEVGLNKKVECLFIDDDETETYKIVTPIRGDTMENRISIESPLGKTLLRHHVGDIVHVTTEAGGYDLKILSITPDDTDDEIRSF